MGLSSTSELERQFCWNSLIHKHLERVCGCLCVRVCCRVAHTPVHFLDEPTHVVFLANSSERERAFVCVRVRECVRAFVDAPCSWPIN